MNSYDYIKKEVELQYNYKLDDQVQYSKPKHLVNDIFRSLESSVSCEFGGFSALGLTNQEVKSIIKSYIEEHPISLIDERD